MTGQRVRRAGRGQMFRRIPLAAAVALAFAMPAWAQDAGQQAPEKAMIKD